MSFYSNLAEFGSKYAAVSDLGDCITYRELSDFSQMIQSVAKTRSLVFVLCENQIGSLAGCVSFLNARVVPLLLDAGINRDLLWKLIDIYKPEYLYLPLRLIGEFSKYSVHLSQYDYCLLGTGATSDVPFHDELAMLVSTSGSTGSPRLVRQSYRNLASNGSSIVQYLGLNENERPISTLPMHYTYGFSILNSHLLVGATLLLTTRTLVEKTFWSFLREQKATSFGGVPYTFETLKRLRFFQMDLPSLKTITQAGGKLTVSLSREFAEFAKSKEIRFFTMYGQTEATARMSYLPSEYSISKCGSIGVAIPRGTLYLVDDKGSIIENSDQVGELVYSGENVTLGYAECREDLSKGDERSGVLFTGDMAKRDADGFYYITGRKKRFIKLFGNRINLDEAEQLLKGHVSDCACSGTDERMHIYVTVPGKEEELRQLLSLKMGIHPSAFAVKFIPEIPKSEAGKILYSKLTSNEPI